MDLSPDIVSQVLTAVATGGAVYGGIRADIKSLRDKADRAQNTADTAHKRLDSIFDRRNK